ncbi:MAG: hypothetical protein ACAI38_16280 [Myxococcota bacterium]
MTVRGTQVAERSSSLANVATLPPLAIEHLPVPVPVAEHPSRARSLFEVADRLIGGTHAAAVGKGSYAGPSLPERLDNTMAVWGTGYVFGVGAAVATAIGWAEPSPFFLGLIAGAVSMWPVALGIEHWKGAARAKAIPVGKARPYLEAFKSGGVQTQAVVTRLAAKASITVSSNAIAGQEFRQQLDEIAAVKVVAGEAAEQRISALCELASLMPRKHRLDATSPRAILGAFEKLEPADRADVAPLLLARLFRGETLRWKLPDTTRSGDLYAALVATQPGLVTSRDELQKLVAPAPVDAREAS